MQRLTSLAQAYKALKDFDRAMDAKYQRDPSCNRLESLTLEEIAECRRLGIARDVAARPCSGNEYAQVVREYRINAEEDARERFKNALTEGDD